MPSFEHLESTRIVVEMVSISNSGSKRPSGASILIQTTRRLREDVRWLALDFHRASTMAAKCSSRNDPHSQGISSARSSGTRECPSPVDSVSRDRAPSSSESATHSTSFSSCIAGRAWRQLRRSFPEMCPVPSHPSEKFWIGHCDRFRSDMNLAPHDSSSSGLCRCPNTATYRDMLRSEGKAKPSIKSNTKPESSPNPIALK
ncbi:hypothetical protein FIBSPDRAFT_217797 [Athelia psychrophila]|uniref:Uncharacterized protein n=1 Tax=Athelia psychrophila TaxID=1759441 RepID=A0A165ZEQ1_9AGAM|nr:hypothetical protein FIBSPDRAFT_217797 [Fibularhizoctonia sp. CBS 109695]